MATYSYDEIMGNKGKSTYTFEELTQKPEAPSIPQGGSFADPLAQGLSFGFADELTGALGATFGMLPESMGGQPAGKSWTENYAGIRDQARQQNEDFSERNPKSAMALELAGGLATGGAGGAKTLAKQAVNTPKYLKYLKTAGTSAIGGGVYGFGVGEGKEDSINKAKQGFTVGAVAGPAMKYGIDKGTKAITGRIAAKKLNANTSTIDEVTDKARSLYKQSNEIGMSFKPEKLQELTGKIFNDVKSKGYDKDLQPSVNRILARFSEEIEEGGPITLEKLDTLRKVVSGAYGDNKAQNMMVSMIVDRMDDFALSLSKKDLVSGTPQATRIIKEARNLWTIKSKHDVLAEAIRKAESQASGVENGIRIQFRHILNNNKKFKRFTKTEQKMIKDVVDGNMTRNTLRGLGRFAPVDGVTSHWLSSLMGAGGGYVAGGPAGMFAVPLAGQGAQALSRSATQGSANNVINQVLRGVNGKTIPDVTNPMMSRVQRITDPFASAVGMQDYGLLDQY